MIKLRYDIQKANEAGVKVHPQINMIDMGYEPEKAIPMPVNQTWIFEVEDIINPLPEYLERMP